MSQQVLRRITTTAFQTLFWCLVVGVLVQNLILLRQNRRLRAEAGLPAPEVKQGSVLRNLSGLSLGGVLQPIMLPSSGSQRTLIITLSPGCPGCQANQTRWAALADVFKKRSGWRVLWVSRDPASITKQYCLEKRIPLSDALADPPYRTYLQLGLHTVPETIVVGPGGVVEKSWPGVLSPIVWKVVIAYLGIPESAPEVKSSAGMTAMGSHTGGYEFPATGQSGNVLKP